MERRYSELLTIGETDSRARKRSEGERDRDRVLYSAAFQRLAGITQVIPAGTGQAVHSRLTHSLKVAQVTRRLTQRLLKHHPELESVSSATGPTSGPMASRATRNRSDLSLGLLSAGRTLTGNNSASTSPGGLWMGR
jgi:dGTP triphosphohydrolase